MWKKLGEEDKEAIFSYISKDRELNLFIYGDIENEGVSSKNVSAYFLLREGKIDCLLLRYVHNYVIYSDHDDYEAKEAAAFLKNEKTINGISGKGKIIEKLVPFLPQFELSKDTMLSLHKKKIEPPLLPSGFHFEEIQSKEALDEAAILLLSIEEFALTYHGEDYIEKKRRAKTGIDPKNGHFNLGIYFENELVAIGSLTAKTKMAAMVVGVATKDGYRSRGLASSLISKIGEIAFNEMKLDYLCLFYDNPNAGSIYHKAGFKEVGPYDILQKAS